jgi:metallophosphoesterase (TIGR00282 family)
VGDVVGEAGLACLARNLRGLKRQLAVDFTVVNGENAAGMGILPRQAEEILDSGADVITLGNHTWDKEQICGFLDDSPYILRPGNFPDALPGRGLGVYDGPRGLRIGVLNLMGRVNLNPHLDSPFVKADKLLPGLEADIILVDFHGETTSEKGAFARYLDGRVSAVWGTHTHVPTADTRILPGGTGFVTDLGMTAARNSVIGLDIGDSLHLFVSGTHTKYRPAEGAGVLNAVLFTVESGTGQCTEVARADWNG